MNPVNVLLVEDSEIEIFLTTKAFEYTKSKSNISVARDGEQAIKLLDFYLQEPGSVLPDMVLLDVDLPKVNGHEVLKYIKSNDRLRHIIVIMLTKSSVETDIMESYRHFANCYITKPPEVDNFLEIIKKLDKFWELVSAMPLSGDQNNDMQNKRLQVF